MTELHELRDWLNSDKRNFDTGLHLHRAYFNDVDMRRYLEAHRPEKKLYEIIRDRVIELKEALTAPAEPIVEEMPVKSKPKAKELASDGRPAQKHELIQNLEKQWKQLRAEQGVWHTQMSDIGLDAKGNPREAVTKQEQERRAELATLLVEHDKKVKAIWNEIDYIEINGVPPVQNKKQLPVETNESDFKRLKNSINPGISKLKKKISDKKLEMQDQRGKDWEKSNKSLSAWETQLKELEAEKLKITHGQEQAA